MNGDQGTILRETKGQTIVEFNGRNISLDNDERYDLESWHMQPLFTQARVQNILE